jgi:hypothetical protein
METIRLGKNENEHNNHNKSSVLSVITKVLQEAIQIDSDDEIVTMQMNRAAKLEETFGTEEQEENEMDDDPLMMEDGYDDADGTANLETDSVPTGSHHAVVSHLFYDSDDDVLLIGDGYNTADCNAELESERVLKESQVAANLEERIMKLRHLGRVSSYICLIMCWPYVRMICWVVGSLHWARVRFC